MKKILIITLVLMNFIVFAQTKSCNQYVNEFIMKVNSANNCASLNDAYQILKYISTAYMTKSTDSNPFAGGHAKTNCGFELAEMGGQSAVTKLTELSGSFKCVFDKEGDRLLDSEELITGSQPAENIGSNNTNEVNNNQNEYIDEDNGPPTKRFDFNFGDISVGHGFTKQINLGNTIRSSKTNWGAIELQNSGSNLTVKFNNKFRGQFKKIIEVDFVDNSHGTVYILGTAGE